MRPALVALLAATALGVAACVGPDSVTADPATRTDDSKLPITPAVDTAGVGQRVSFRFVGDTQHVVSWRVSDTTIARIVGQGGGLVSLNALREGHATLTATSDGERGTATLVVLESYQRDTSVAFVIMVGLVRVPVGDTALLGPNVSDAYLSPLPDRPMTVTLSDSTVARRIGGQYPHDLRLVALKNGTTSVTVTVEGKSDCGQLLVADSMPDVPTLCPERVPVAYGTLVPTDVTGEVADSQYFHAWLYDARGFEVSHRNATWSVGDTTIVQIRPFKNEGHRGSITPMAIAYLRRTGTTTLVATSEGVSISATITVR